MNECDICMHVCVCVVRLLHYKQGATQLQNSIQCNLTTDFIHLLSVVTLHTSLPAQFITL